MGKLFVSKDRKAMTVGLAAGNGHPRQPRDVAKDYLKKKSAAPRAGGESVSGC